jgi:hypothetical protein
VLVLKRQQYPRAPVLDDDALQIIVVDEGAWFSYRVRGHNWKYRTAYPVAPSYSPGNDNPVQITADGGTTPDEDLWVRTSQQWLANRQPVVADDDLPTQDPSFDDDGWSAQTQRTWVAAKVSVLDDGDIFQSAFGLEDDNSFAYRNRVAGWKLFYPARRGGSSDNSQTFIFDDDPWRAVSQRLWGYSRPVTDDEALPQTTLFGLDDDPSFSYRNRVASGKIFYPSRRGGSADNSDPITPLGVEDDPWFQPRQLPWKLSRAFNADEEYVNTCAEDYLWFATQEFWKTPLVAATYDETLPTSLLFGLEEDAHLYWSRAARHPRFASAMQGRLTDAEVLAILASAARSFVFII